MKNSLSLALLLLFLTSASGFAAAGLIKIDLSTGSPKDKEAMVFTKDKLTAKSGTRVTLTLKNGATAKGTFYNFVLVTPGSAQAVIDASIKAGADRAWVAAGPNIIARTKLLDAGESDTIDFMVPAEPGDYPYVCTYPGHATMKGVFKVTK